MFQPERLSYVGNENGMETYDYDGIRIYKMITNRSDGRYLYVGVARYVSQIFNREMLAWFGIDEQRDYGSCQLPDRSCFFYQKRHRRAA